MQSWTSVEADRFFAAALKSVVHRTEYPWHSSACDNLFQARSGGFAAGRFLIVIQSHIFYASTCLNITAHLRWGGRSNCTHGFVVAESGILSA